MPTNFFRIGFFWILCFMVAGYSCKSKEKAPVPETTVKTESPPPLDAPLSTGKVSHQFRADGCETVVIVDNPNGGKELILIPKDKLGEFDVDGLKIAFHYRVLRMPNPPGCKSGIPASLTDIMKK